MDLRTMKISNDFPTKANNVIIDFLCFGKEQEYNLLKFKFRYKVLFTLFTHGKTFGYDFCVL